jgi:hypothetical protein
MTKQRLLSTILLMFSIMPLSINAQNTNTPFIHFKKFKKNDAEKLFLRFENLNFVKNDEYNSNYIEGATNIGYIATPKLVYYPNSLIRIEAGARFQKFSGKNKYNKIEPVFSAIYRASSKSKIILGSLNQDNNHNLSAPLFDPDSYFMKKNENGLQYQYQSSKLRLDTWINWEQFIMDNDPFQEKFTVGVSGRWQINSINRKNQLYFPFEALVTHRGGEIDSSKDNIQTLTNISTGFEYNKKFENRRLKSLNFKYRFYSFIDNSSVKEFTYKKGFAHYPQIEFKTKKSSINLGYWNGYRFIASRGHEIFQSISIDNPNLGQERRQIATFNYYYDNQISKGIHLGGKLDIFHDITKTKTDYIAAIYLRITGNFFLKKVKWN